MKWLAVKKRISYFLSSEFFTDALRTTISIILPVWTLFALGKPQIAVTVGVGTLLASLTDASGTSNDKKTGSLISIILFFFAALVTSFCWPYPWLMGIVLFIFCLGFSMLSALGNRFSIIGTTAIALCIFIIGLKPVNGFEFSAYLLTGGICYYIISLIQVWMWPFRSLRQAVAECVNATALYMKARTSFYNYNIPLENCYHNIIPLHTLVNEKQEAVRDLLLRDKLAMHPDNKNGQRLLKIATQVIDLYERITTVHFDYQHFRKEFGFTGALEIVSRLVEIMALELEQASHAFYLNQKNQPDLHTTEIEYLEGRLSYVIEKETPANASLLKGLKQNIDDINSRIQHLKTMLYGEDQLPIAEDEALTYESFLTYQPQTFNQLKTHFSFKSPVFRFSLRLTIACVFSYCLGQILPLGNYSYWIMLTVIIVMKPAYSITKARNKQRLIGTLIGVGIGLLLLATIQNAAVLITISLVFLLGFYTFYRNRFVLGVMFITPMVMITLHIYSGRQTVFIIERVYDTLIGCGIALAASYVFPVWEKHGLSANIKEVLKANYAYLESLYQQLTGQQPAFNDYKLLRKNVYTKLANFSAAFQRLLQEPHKTEVSIEHLQRFQALNHQLYGSVASLVLQDLNSQHTAQNQALTAGALHNLQSCISTAGELTADNSIAVHDSETAGIQFRNILSITAELKQLYIEIEKD